jgi:hypothetical protein
MIDAIKDVFARIIRNITKSAEALTSQGVLVTPTGEIVVTEPVLQRLSDKVSAILIAGAALFFLVSPIQGKTTMAIGDQLMRAATYLWSGEKNGQSVRQEGFAI